MDHVTDHGHTHVHGEGHDHGHDHHHDHDHDSGEYYLQQLLTVFISGAFGVAGVLMYTLHDTVQGEPMRKIAHVLAEPFHIWVLIGSIVLLVLTAIRGVSLWMASGAKAHVHTHDHHDHKPGEACDHPSHVHTHDHDHGDHSADDHDHGNIYWRVIILAFPIALLAMGLPNGGFSEERLRAMLGDSKDIGEFADVASKGDTITFSFDDLAKASYSPASREVNSGVTAIVSGKLKSSDNPSGKEFTLFYEKMTCCSADQILLKARGVVANPSQLDRFRRKGFPNVTIKGKLQFVEEAPGQFTPVIRVFEDGGIKEKGKG